MKQDNQQSLVNSLRQTLSINPMHIQTLFDLGRVLSNQDDYAEALTCFDKIIGINPQHAVAHNARGIMLSHLGRREEAIIAFQHATHLKPDYASPFNNLGNEYLHLGQYDTALFNFDLAVSAQPDFANGHNGRGNVLLMLNRFEEAVASFDSAIELSRLDADPHNGRGSALSCLKRYDEAVLSFEQAISLEPNLADAKRNLGNAYYYQERFKEAAEVYEQAELLAPGKADGYWRLGRVYSKLDRQADALKALEQSLSIDPSKSECYQGIAEIYRLLGRYDVAYRTLKTALSKFPNNHALLSGFLFDLNYSSEVSSEENFTWHKMFGERFETTINIESLPHDNIPDPDKRLRVGFVSGDFRQHPVGLFMESLLCALSKSDLDLYAYINQPVDDEITGRLRKFIDVWHDTWKQPDSAVAEQVRADGVDILIDLSGHTGGNRLMMFAHKPAPVQVTYLGYSCTTGLSGIDYIIGNKWLMPGDATGLYTETPYPLPGTQICFTPPTLDIPCGVLPALENGHVTFGCFNNLSKMSHATVACWSNILHAVPHSKLVLKSKELDSAEVRASVLSRFTQHRIGEERLILRGRTDNFREHLATYQIVDIALDPFPYNGTTTSMDCLWMGVPFLSLGGDRYISRVGLSILQTMRMPDWVATSEADYVSRATRFACDLNALTQLRAELRQRFIYSPLCDASRFANELETAFRTMWRDWCLVSSSDRTS